MIENIRQSKLLEFSVVQENGSYLATLKNASSYLENASDNLQALRTDMEDKIERLHKEREIQLEVREKRLEGSTFFFLFFFNIALLVSGSSTGLKSRPKQKDYAFSNSLKR